MGLIEHIARPAVVTEPGNYRTRCGETVTVRTVDRGWASGNYANGIPEKWDVSGRLLPFSESKNDITGKE